MDQPGENPVESRRAFRELFADSGLLPPGRIASGIEREEAFTRLCTRHRGADLLVKGLRFGSGRTKTVRTLFRVDEHPEDVAIEVRLPWLHNPQVHCRINGEEVRVLGIASDDAGTPAHLPGRLHNDVLCAAIDAARRMLPHYRGDLWLDFAVTDGVIGGQKLVLFGVRTSAAAR